MNEIIKDPLDPTASTLPEKTTEHPFTEIVRFVLIALIIVVPIRMFIAQPFIVSGASMEYTFENGQYLIVDQASYLFEDPARGDVIIFRYPLDPSKYFIKRVIGIPGDTVTIEGDLVTITNDNHPDGAILREPYIRTMSDTATYKETLDEEEYFVMGDNRDHSSDSRMWGILHRDNIVGRAFLRLFPVGTVSTWPGKYDTEDLLINK